MDIDSSEIKELKRIVWRTAIADRVERFKAVLNSPEKQKYFDSVFASQLTTKLDRLFRFQIALAAIYTALMLSLYTAQDPTKSEFQILGYSFKNLGYYKEFLLFAAALITPISSIASAYRRYLVELRRATLQKLYPDPDVLEFATHLYADNFIDPLIKDHKRPDRVPHVLTRTLVAVFGVALIALAATFVFASFVLQLSVIYDVATKPASTPLVNTFIVAFALGAIALSWLVGLLQLPLPEVDVGVYTQLSHLKESEPAKYKDVMSRICSESARKEKIGNVAAGCIGFLFIYLAIAAITISSPESVWSAFLKAIPGIAIAMFVSTSAAKHIKRRVYGSYFRSFPDGTDKELKEFTIATRKVRLLRIASVTLVSLIYSISVLRTL